MARTDAQTTITITDKEFALLDEIAHSDYTAVNGATPEHLDDVGGVWFWADELAGSCETNKLGVAALVGSLTEKGLVKTYMVSAAERRSGDEDAIWMTQAGFDAWKAVHDSNERIAGQPDIEPDLNLLTPVEQRFLFGDDDERGLVVA